MLGYLPGDILVKLDRASMATSLEARCPPLTIESWNFAWRLPNKAKVRDGQANGSCVRSLAGTCPVT